MATTCNAVAYDVKLVEHLAPYLGPMTKLELKALTKFTAQGIIQRDRVAEVAMANVGGFEINSIFGMDFSDGSDAKTVVSSARCNNPAKNQWMNSFEVRNIATKTGDLRVIAYNKILDKFQYFLIPHKAYKHLKTTLSIIIETKVSKGDPGFTGIGKTTRKFWEYECDTFEELCTGKVDLKAKAIKASAKRTEINSSEWLPLSGTDGKLYQMGCA